MMLFNVMSYRYLLINASDLLFVAGTFLPYKKLPYGAGFEVSVGFRVEKWP